MYGMGVCLTKVYEHIVYYDVLWHMPGWGICMCN